MTDIQDVVVNSLSRMGESALEGGEMALASAGAELIVAQIRAHVGAYPGAFIDALPYAKTLEPLVLSFLVHVATSLWGAKIPHADKLRELSLKASTAEFYELAKPILGDLMKAFKGMASGLGTAAE